MYVLVSFNFQNDRSHVATVTGKINKILNITLHNG